MITDRRLRVTLYSYNTSVIKNILSSALSVALLQPLVIFSQNLSFFLYRSADCLNDSSIYT